ncbi:DUF362 domain-containing protein, partial [candidate division WOR-3 bacterium]|nr:DUF362 domain-containing protein [candidate division WOR-3 bacterium]
MDEVAISKAGGYYPDTFPFNPDHAYPEYKGEVSDKPNYIYRAVRKNFELLAYDKEHFGKKNWNPLGFLIVPQDRVFIKPNLVAHRYRASCPKKGNVYSVITHPSVVRAVADYVAIALKGEGEIVIGDNPSIDADFDKLCKTTKLDLFESFYKEKFGARCRMLDLREYHCDDLKYYGFRTKMKKLKGDPEGNSIIDLGKESLFYGLNSILFRGIYTKRWGTIKHHHGDRHENCISNTILNSDVFISIPKLKTHRKVGATLNIKGLVGISADKDFLIHWRIGFPKLGGDEYPNPERFIDYPILTFRHLINDFLPEKLYIWFRHHTKGTILED